MFPDTRCWEIVQCVCNSLEDSLIQISGCQIPKWFATTSPKARAPVMATNAPIHVLLVLIVDKSFIRNHIVQAPFWLTRINLDISMDKQSHAQ